MGNLMQDLRYAIRQLRSSPGFAFTAVLSLTLGIGATTAIFSVVYGILLNPYPYQDADRMVHVELRDKGDRGPLLFVNSTEYQDLRRVSAIDDVFLQQGGSQTLTGDQLPVSVQVGRYSTNLFTYMGVPALAGRQFTPADAPHGNPNPVAVLSYLFWQRQYGGNRDVLGKTIQLDHKSYTVIGVTQPRFTWGDSDVYLPAVPNADPHDYWMSFIKLKPGAKHSAVAAELQVLVDRFTKDDPNDFRRNRRVAIVTLNEEVLGHFAGILTLLFGAVVALLAIGCANVSILLLARGTARKHELALRASIGASQARLIRQLLTEAVLLSVTGAALGVLVAYRGVIAISSMMPLYSFPHEASIHVNGVVLVFTAAVSLITGILFGIWPAWQLSRPDLAELIQSGSTRHSGGAQSRRTHRLLIAGQVALTLVMLAGAGAAIRSFIALTRTPLGFDPDNIIEMNVSLPKGAHPTWQERLNANEAVRQAITEVPGVASAAVSTSWFPPFGGFVGKIEVQGKPSLGDAQSELALISPQEFATLHIPLLSGRIFDDAETVRAGHLALVNQSFVKQFLSDRDPIGQSVRSPMLKVDQPDLITAPGADNWLQIIGVVADSKDDGLDHPVKPAVFLPYSFVLLPEESLIVRTKGDPGSMTPAIKQRLSQLNAEMVVSQDRTLAWWLDTRGWGHERFLATLFSLFAILALLLAATGLFSVVSYAVTQRTQEVGIRMALGAPRSSILGLVLSSTGATLGLGVGVGLALSLGLGRMVASWTGGGSPRDPGTLLAAAMVLLLVATAACVFPAWRAATIDPVQALRTE